MTTRPSTNALLPAQSVQERGIQPKNKLGQNFLIDLNLLDLIVRSAELTRRGSGPGGRQRHRQPDRAAGRAGRGRASASRSIRRFTALAEETRRAAATTWSCCTPTS